MKLFLSQVDIKIKNYDIIDLTRRNNMLVSNDWKDYECIDAGNGETDKAYIYDVSKKFSNITLIVNKRNRGKGYSVCKAIKEAHKIGITHLFQIDADGQHDMEQVKNFLQRNIRQL